MIKKTKLELIEENQSLLDKSNEYMLQMEKLEEKNKKLEEENKKLIEDFVKNYDYVITYNRCNRTVHLFQEGKEITGITKINYEANLDSIPTFELEVH